MSGRNMYTYTQISLYRKRSLKLKAFHANVLIIIASGVDGTIKHSLIHLIYLSLTVALLHQKHNENEN